MERMEPIWIKYSKIARQQYITGVALSQPRQFAVVGQIQQAACLTMVTRHDTAMSLDFR